jgi:hypothetical protein
MKRHVLLSVTSLLSILLMTLHFTSDTLRAGAGTAEAGGLTLVAVPILVVWLYGALLLNEKRSGNIIMLVGSLLALGMPVDHKIGAVNLAGSEAARASGAFLFVWTLHALGVTGMFSFVLAVLELRRPKRGEPR